PNVLFKVMSEMLKLGCECIVMEASSHALYLEKLSSLYAEVGVLTNCSRDHLDFFKTIERYQDAKYKMFDEKMIKWAVVNGDDILGKRIIENNPLPIVRYGKNEAYEISFSNLTYNNKTEFDVTFGGETHHVTTDLIGEFNVYNILAGIATARLLNVSEENIFTAVKNMKVVGGRFEKIPNNFGLNIVIDFAHTPDSVENVIKAAKNIDKKAKIITVIGCGGDRDRGKRAIMGQIATEQSDYVVVTTDNPRSENPLQILADIERGINQQTAAYAVIEGRKLAIEHAISKANQGDFVLILGKGKEEYIDIEGVKYPYSDYTSVYEILEKMKAD
ncbi:MAG: UDP-N-acetylmuramoyl-L-alanyl-D-glutamate--2,6-diaminopimelate ligase, partial [Clostridia bacterium]